MSEECIATLVPNRQVMLTVGGRELGTTWAGPGGLLVLECQEQMLRAAGWVRTSTWEPLGIDRDYSTVGDCWTAKVTRIGEDDE